MQSCAVLGAGGHAKVAIATLRDAGWAVAGVYDDDPARHGQTLLDIPIVGNLEAGFATGLPLHIAIGSNEARKRLAGEAAQWAVAVHPRAELDASASMGVGALVCMGAILQVDARVGRHVIVNTGAIVEHDCQVGDFVHLAPGSILAGGVEVGEGAMIGMGARVLPGLKIGAWATVGAGAVVTRSVAEGQTVAGCPARVLE